MAVVAHHHRTRADRRPDVAETTFLSDPGLVLPPELDWLAGGAARQRSLQQAGKVYGMARPPFLPRSACRPPEEMGAGAMYITVLGIDLGKNSLCGRPR